MIGLLLRTVGLETGATGCLAILVACCLAAGLYKCSQCRMRDCPCLKWCMLATGQDTFQDFNLFIIVHECFYTATDADLMTIVRITAGEQTASTDAHKRVFQQPMAVLIEQGTEKLEVEIMDSWGSHRWAKMELEMAEMLETLENEGGYREHTFNMKAVKRGFASPRIKLTIHKGKSEDVEKGLLSNIDVSEDHTGMMVLHHLQKVQEAEMLARGSIPAEEENSGKVLSVGALLDAACSGELELLGAWGAKNKVWVDVRSRPQVKRSYIGVWSDKKDWENRREPTHMIYLLRIRSVQAHPSMDDSFMINEVLRSGSIQQYTFFHVDRSRDVWVQTLSLLINNERESKEKMDQK